MVNDPDGEARKIILAGSFRKQEVTLIVRYGIEEINAPAGVLAVRLQRGKRPTSICICRNENL